MDWRDRMLIGFCGRAGAGKDLAGSFLTQPSKVNPCVVSFTRLNFSDALKRAACAITGWDLGALESQAFKADYDPVFGERRAFLQKLGTEVGRSMDADLWIKAWVAAYTRRPGHVAVTDVRFANEAETLKRIGGLLVCVRRSVAEAAPITHESEQHFAHLGHHVQLHNESTPDALFEQIETLFTMRRRPLRDGWFWELP